jgi:hypothetical protein
LALADDTTCRSTTVPAVIAAVWIASLHEVADAPEIVHVIVVGLPPMRNVNTNVCPEPGLFVVFT